MIRTRCAGASVSREIRAGPVFVSSLRCSTWASPPRADPTGCRDLPREASQALPSVRPSGCRARPIPKSPLVFSRENERGTIRNSQKGNPPDQPRRVRRADRLPPQWEWSRRALHDSCSPSPVGSPNPGIRLPSDEIRGRIIQTGGMIRLFRRVFPRFFVRRILVRRQRCRCACYGRRHREDSLDPISPTSFLWSLRGIMDEVTTGFGWPAPLASFIGG